MNEKPTDYFGNEIEIGDVIAYATSTSSSAAMNHGRVYNIRPYPGTRYNWNTKQHEEVTLFKLGVEKFGRASYFEMQADENRSKVTIEKTNRCINLSKCQAVLDKIPK